MLTLKTSLPGPCVRGEYADDFDSLTRYGGRVLWESRNRFGLDTSLDYYREALANDSHDDLWTGDANVVFRFAQSEYLMMRTGLGVNYMSADHGTDLGFNFTYGGDWFPMKPWIVSAEIDWGWLGDAGLFQGRATIGVNIQNVEVYADSATTMSVQLRFKASSPACKSGTELPHPLHIPLPMLAERFQVFAKKILETSDLLSGSWFPKGLLSGEPFKVSDVVFFAHTNKSYSAPTHRHTPGARSWDFENGHRPSTAS